MDTEHSGGPMAAVASEAEYMEWTRIFESTPLPIRRWVREVVDDSADTLASLFYARMMEDREAAPFLNNETVQGRLHGAMQQWLRMLFEGESADSFSQVMAMQRHVGEVHARVDVPVSIVARGARVMKAEILRRLHAGRDRAVDLVAAVIYVGDLMDLAFEVMSSAYVRSHERNARMDEAYRMFSFGQNMSVERERQRAALLDWESQVLYLAMTADDGSRPLPPLAESSFGMWLQHKAMAIFEGSPELPAIEACMRQIDEQLLPTCQSRMARGDLKAARAMIREVQVQAEQLKFYLSAMFEHVLEVESGKDSLTQLLNRRFLPAILSREVEISRRHDKRFALLLLDVDHFKQINDGHGHHAGDRILQQMAALLVSSVRAGDFVFRYGGEEFLIVLVETDEQKAMRVAEKLRQRVAEEPFNLPDGRPLSVTLSVGLAVHDGHPDYQRLVDRADKALYQAKHGGRNCCMLDAHGEVHCEQA